MCENPTPWPTPRKSNPTINFGAIIPSPWTDEEWERIYQDWMDGKGFDVDTPDAPRENDSVEERL